MAFSEDAKNSKIFHIFLCSLHIFFFVVGGVGVEWSGAKEY